jgi:sirohydrochlorin ferrochelatase
MKRITLILLLFTLMPVAGRSQVSANDSTAPAPKPPRPGILLLAHGGALEWNEEVHHVADRTDLDIPTEVAFGMATRSTMQAAIDRLVRRHVTEIIAVPLFVSSHSSVIDSSAYLLGLRAQMPEDLKDFAAMDHGESMGHDGTMDHSTMHDTDATANSMKPIRAPVPIRMVPALDAHPIVADILVDRAASISKDPPHEVVILVAHGPVPEDDNKLWLHDMDILAEQIRGRAQYATIDCLTLRDDADDPVRNAATNQLRQKVAEVTNSGRTALIVPLLLSYGGIEGGLRKRLDGLVYRMPAQALLPDERIVDWVVSTAQKSTGEITKGSVR